MEFKQLEQAVSVIETMVKESRHVGELAFMVVTVSLILVSAFAVTSWLNALRSRSERLATKEAQEHANKLQEKLNTSIAASHDKMAEAVCKMADNDARAVECQERIQLQVLKLHEQHLTVFGVVDEALAIAEEYGPSDSIRAGAKRIRNKLERHRD